MSIASAGAVRSKTPGLEWSSCSIQTTIVKCWSVLSMGRLLCFIAYGLRPNDSYALMHKSACKSIDRLQVFTSATSGLPRRQPGGRRSSDQRNISKFTTSRPLSAARCIACSTSTSKLAVPLHVVLSFSYLLARYQLLSNSKRDTTGEYTSFNDS